MTNNIESDVNEILDDYNRSKESNMATIIKLYDNDASDIYKIKLGLYNIYDGVLSSEYGSDDMLVSYIYKLINEYVGEENIDFMIIMGATSHSYQHTIEKINDFIQLRQHSSAIISFGSIDHKTCLYMKKINTDISITHINTGLGIDETYEKYEEYINIFKTITIKINQMPNFINLIKPMLFFKYISKKHLKLSGSNDDLYFGFYTKLIYNKIINYKIALDRYNEIRKAGINFADILINTNTSDDFIIYMFFELLLNNKNVYKILNNIFNSESNNLKLLELPEKWELLKGHKITDKHQLNYYNLAINTFKFSAHNDKLFVKPQMSGTCVYMSFIMTLIYHYSITHNIDTFINMYPYIINNGYEIIKNKITSDNITFSEMFAKNHINAAGIINKLYNDEIIDFNSIF